jgi:hypothetical protein
MDFVFGKLCFDEMVERNLFLKNGKRNYPNFQCLPNKNA